MGFQTYLVPFSTVFFLYDKDIPIPVHFLIVLRHSSKVFSLFVLIVKMKTYLVSCADFAVIVYRSHAFNECVSVYLDNCPCLIIIGPLCFEENLVKRDFYYSARTPP